MEGSARACYRFVVDRTATGVQALVLVLVLEAGDINYLKQIKKRCCFQGIVVFYGTPMILANFLKHKRPRV